MHRQAMISSRDNRRECWHPEHQVFHTPRRGARLRRRRQQAQVPTRVRVRASPTPQGPALIVGRHQICKSPRRRSSHYRQTLLLPILLAQRSRIHSSGLHIQSDACTLCQHPTFKRMRIGQTGYGRATKTNLRRRGPAPATIRDRPVVIYSPSPTINHPSACTALVRTHRHLSINRHILASRTLNADPNQTSSCMDAF
jgi:hypothetical protein